MQKEITAAGARRGSRVIVILACLAFAAAAALGCSDAVTTWSARSASPGGQWTAIAKSQQWTGPGNDYAATSVAIAPAGHPDRTREVILISQNFATIRLQMRWLGPDALCMGFAPSSRPGDAVSLDYLVSHMWGIRISAQPIGACPVTSRSASRPMVGSGKWWKKR